MKCDYSALGGFCRLHMSRRSASANGVRAAFNILTKQDGIMGATAEKRAEIERRGIELEYTTLRSEILKRIEMRQQIVSIALTLAGTFLGAGLSNESGALIHPTLDAF